MKTILAVDDSIINLKSIKRLLSDKYKVIAVSSSSDAFAYLENAQPSLILLDIMMPDMDGFEMMNVLKADKRFMNIPVIFLTADNDKEKEVRGFRMGAMDFIVKPFEPDIVMSRIDKTIELESLRHNLEAEVRVKAKEIENITLQSIAAVANTVDSKDKYAKGHSVNVAEISEEIAKRLKWNADRITNLHYIALLHDIGKIGIPDNLFNKQTKFTKEEWDLIRQHTIMGADILENISIEKAAVGAKYHHEWFDGNGYNEGLSGENIPIEARIIAVADAYDSMVNDRSYRKRLSDEDILQELISGKGKQFDPEITDVMLEMLKEGFQLPSNLEEKMVANNGIISDSASLLRKVMTEYAVEAQNEANRDPLTGLWNRKYTSFEVNRKLSQPQATGVAFMVDIDNFKGINDNYGHIFGDDILIKISKVISEIVRQNDIACRIGGDEFFLYFNNVDSPETIQILATRLINALNEKVKYPDKTRGAAASIGIAVAPKDGNDFEVLYAKADKALYHAKNNGKNIYHFFSNETNNYVGSDSIKEDLYYIRQMLSEEEPIQGSYYVEYEGFKNISRFIRRSVERSDRHVAYILFTITGNGGVVPPIENLQNNIAWLEDAIKESLRIGDVATRYSSTQMVVILMDANPENTQMVANRIFSDFIQRLSDGSIELHYDIQQLKINDKDRK